MMLSSLEIPFAVAVGHLSCCIDVTVVWVAADEGRCLEAQVDRTPATWAFELQTLHAAVTLRAVKPEAGH